MQIEISSQTLNLIELKKFKKKFKKSSTTDMALLKSFGQDFDISSQLNQLIDDENKSVRRQNHNIVRALRKLKIVTEESDIEFDKSDGDDEK